MENVLWSDPSDGGFLSSPSRIGLCLMRSDLSTEPVRVFLLTENRLLRDALLRVLRSKEDLLTVGAISF